MKRNIVVLLLILGFLSGSCGYKQKELAAKRINKAGNTIAVAKSQGMEGVNPAKMAMAESYYKKAVGDFNQKPRGIGLLNAMRQSGALKQSAIIYASLAIKEAQEALTAAEKESKNMVSVQNLKDENENLQQNIAELRSTMELLQQEREQAMQQSESVEDNQDNEHLSEESSRLYNEIEKLKATLGYLENKQKRNVQTIKSSSTRNALYEKAFWMFHNNRFAESREAFEYYLELFPDNDLSDNAKYWIGECEYSMGNFPEAVLSFQAVLTDFETSNKYSDSLLKLGLCHMRMKHNDKAEQYWNELIKRYPGSHAALLVKKYIGQ